MDTQGIKGLIFDYGGTIDTDGIHWMNLIWGWYLYFNLPVTPCDYKKIYVLVEKLLESKKYIKKDDSFYDVLKTKIGIQLQYLYDKSNKEIDKRCLTPYAEDIAHECCHYVEGVLKDTVPVIAKLSKKYRIGIVSNFYGNLDRVLKDFGIYPYINVTVDSGIEGIRKPHPDIYSRGIERLGLQPEETIIVGDSLANDMAPAKTIGCKAVWLNRYEKSQHPSKECQPDAIIQSLVKLEDLV